MELDAYKTELARWVGAWITKPDNQPFVQACRDAATEYLSTRTGAKKRSKDAHALTTDITVENVYELFIKATSQDCWEGDRHYGGFFGCASLNTLLMEQVIIRCHQDTWRALEENEIKVNSGLLVKLCRKTDDLLRLGGLQALCHDIYKLMDPLKLTQLRAPSPAP